MAWHRGLHRLTALDVWALGGCFVCTQVPEEQRASTYLPVSPLFKQRRWARISWQYIIEYVKGVSGLQVVKNVAEQRSSRHRDTSRSRQAEAAMEAAAFTPRS